MSRLYRFGLLVGLVAVLGRGTFADDFADQRLTNWHQWRGPLATGVAPQADPPLTWSKRENIQWKVAIPGLGNASPIVWGDQVFVLTAVDTGQVDPNLPPPEDQPERPFGIVYPNTVHDFQVIALDRESGQVKWSHTATSRVPHEGHHGDSSFASCSPTTDGERLYAWFGSPGLFCYDLSGNLLWQRDLGDVSTRVSFGEGSSPVVYGDRLFITRDNEGQSYIVALDTKTGEEVWRTDRDEQTSWATPLVVEHNGRTQVVTNASERVRSYDADDGALLWECSGQVGNVTPTPVTLGETVFCMSGYKGSALQAISLDARGDVTGSDHVVWSRDRGTPYIPSPLLYDGRLYYTQSNEGILSSVEAATGETLMERTRMPGIRRMYASPVAAAGRIYFVSREGSTLVIAPGRELEVLATNLLDDPIDASPAVAGNQLFLRSKQHVYCIAED